MHRAFEHLEDARVAALRDVEAQEPAGGLRNAERIAGRQNVT